MTRIRMFVAAAALVVAPTSVFAGTGAGVEESRFDMEATRTSVLRGKSLYVDPNSTARRQVESWRRSRPAEAALLDREVASQPTGVWFNGWSGNVRSAVSSVVASATRQQALPVLVAYNIPNRDCGSHAAGGESSANSYRRWIRDFAAGIAGRPAIVIVEPDALASTKCLSEAQRAERFSLLKYAVQVLKAEKAFVYLDAGHPNWLSASDAATRLVESGIELADGFALNVSNFVGNAANVRYGDEISQRTGGKHYVIDSSRNGAGPKGGEWCNPEGRALGTRPTTNTAHANLDAFLWVKKPGESDGPCNGGPRSGQWWGDYALSLARNSTPVMAMAGAVRP